MNNKIIIIFLVAITVGAIGYFVSSQTSTPISTELSTSQNLPNTEQIIPIVTTDWKTYRNDKAGFEFLYPKEFSVNTVSVGDISGGDCEGDGCDGIEEWNIGNEKGYINIQIDHDLKNYTLDLWWIDSETYLKYENGKIVACNKKRECTSEAITLDSNELDADGNKIIKQGKNWRAFVIDTIYGSGLAKQYLIPNPSRNIMIEITMEEKLDKNKLFEKIIDSLILVD
jgi:hypothetical protein